MSEKYLTTEGYKPLILPERGEELQQGRQYALTPLVRLILHEVYGLSNIPTIVECLHPKVAATQVVTSRTNLETGQVTVASYTIEPQAATFRVFLALGRILKFEVDLVKIIELAPFYSTSHKLPAFEEDWFKQRNLAPVNRHFRGCTYRWWSKREESLEDGVATKTTKTRKPLDLSILNLTKI